MIIGCPGCRTRYLVDEQALGGRAGRTVRCATCGHTWHQSAPPELPTSVELSRFEAPRLEPALDVPPRPNVAGDVGREVPRRVGALSAPPTRPKRRRRTGLQWFVLVVVFVLVVLAGFFLTREEIVRLWPNLARLFA
jgi:predicted Zn finger-like uncharacterized protein